MINNNFFKDDNNISEEKSNKKFDWLALKQNPWNIFSNYNNKLDNSLEKICELKYEYLNILTEYQNKTKDSQENEHSYNNNKFKHADYFIIFFWTLILCIMTPLFVLGFGLSLNYSKTSVFTLIKQSFYFTPFLYASLSAFFIKFQNKNNYESLMLSINNNLKNLKDKLSNIKQEYKKEVKPLLENSKELNIREELDKQYHTDIPELHTIIQNILEKYYPESNNLKITSNIEDDLEYFNITSGTKYINKISKFLNKVIDNKISSSIGNKIDENLYRYNLNTNQLPSSLVATANTTQKKATNENDNCVLKFFS